MYRVKMLYKTVSESQLGLTDVEEATSGAVDAVDQVDGYAGEPLSNVEDLFCAWNGGVGAGNQVPLKFNEFNPAQNHYLDIISAD
eukprot:g23774.t1